MNTITKHNALSKVSDLNKPAYDLTDLEISYLDLLVGGNGAGSFQVQVNNLDGWSDTVADVLIAIAGPDDNDQPRSLEAAVAFLQAL